MNIYRERIKSLRALMRRRGWDAVVIGGSDPHSSEYPAARWKQVEWLSGFTGEAGDMVVTVDHAGLWTDTRYFIQAQEQLAGTGVELHKTRVPEQILIPQWLAEVAFVGYEGIVVVAFDSMAQPVSFVDELRTEFLTKRKDFFGEESFKLLGVPDLLDSLWQDRPHIPATPVFELPLDTVGESRGDKLDFLRMFTVTRGCDAILLSALDDIAWTLNIRASDIEYNPLCISYLLVTLDSAYWYVRKSDAVPSEETLDAFQSLEADAVSVLPYYDVEMDLSGAGVLPSGKVIADRASLNAHLSGILSSGSLEVVWETSPVQRRKAVKNDVEIKNLRRIHIDDGLAMERFLFWLEESVSGGIAVTEKDAADFLHKLRSSIDGFVGESFATISAWGASAALPHYVTPEYNAPCIESQGLYLCDSGGQYLYGTTDITRTVPMGRCSSLEREDYTLVLQGHIDLARAKFPLGTAGCQIDVLARTPLWRAKRNFGHGTGHGVGFFLGVHEGPQDIRQNFNPQPILPGMVTSDEPGIYREGQHGVRHESLLLCKEAGTNDFGKWLEFEVLTLCHIDTGPIIRELLNKDQITWLNDYNQMVYDTLHRYLPPRVSEWLRNKTLPI